MLQKLFLMSFILIGVHALALPTKNSGSATSTLRQPVGFKEWKNFQIQRASRMLTNVRKEILIHKSKQRNAPQQRAFPQPASRFRHLANYQAGAAKGLAHPRLHPEAKMQRARFNLQMARDLTIHDYFALYLSRIKNDPKTFREVAKKLSPDEMAELLRAYSRSTQGDYRR